MLLIGEPVKLAWNELHDDYALRESSSQSPTSKDNTELQIEYEKILDRVRRTKESVIRMADRHFTAPVEEIDGTVDSVSPGGITLKEFPGRKFQFSSVGMSAADMSARIIGEQNNLTRAEAAGEVDRRRGQLRQYLTDNLSGEAVRLVVPKGAAENAENIRAVVMAGGTNINQVFPSWPTTRTSRTRGRKTLRVKIVCTEYRHLNREVDMPKGKNIALHRKDTKVRKVQVRNRRIAITLYLDKSDALRLAKEIDKRWGKK